jgi:Polyketide cyclase / dehydrase and lipid transport
MASIIKEAVIDARLAEVWDALRDFGAVHTRLAHGFVVECELDGPDCRLVTFHNGSVAREVLVGVDNSAQRLAYSDVEGRWKPPTTTRRRRLSRRVPTAAASSGSRDPRHQTNPLVTRSWR